MKSGSGGSLMKMAGGNHPSGTIQLKNGDIGEIKVHENVISSLARIAALEIDGVSRLAGNPLVDNLAEIVGSRRMQDRAISVQMGSNGRVAVEIKLHLKFGYRLPKVASDVQKAVIASVENTTGMTVTRVDVLVQAVDPPSAEGADGEKAK